MAFKVSTNWLLAVLAGPNLKEIGYLLTKVFTVEYLLSSWQVRDDLSRYLPQNISNLDDPTAILTLQCPPGGQ